MKKSSSSNPPLSISLFLFLSFQYVIIIICHSFCCSALSDIKDVINYSKRFIDCDIAANSLFLSLLSFFLISLHTLQLNNLKKMLYFSVKIWAIISIICIQALCSLDSSEICKTYTWLDDRWTSLQGISLANPVRPCRFFGKLSTSSDLICLLLWHAPYTHLRYDSRSLRGVK